MVPFRIMHITILLGICKVFDGLLHMYIWGTYKAVMGALGSGKTFGSTRTSSSFSLLHPCAERSHSSDIYLALLFFLLMSRPIPGMIARYGRKIA